jgi:hypothetical protein
MSPSGKYFLVHEMFVIRTDELKDQLAMYTP